MGHFLQVFFTNLHIGFISHVQMLDFFGLFFSVMSAPFALLMFFYTFHNQLGVKKYLWLMLAGYSFYTLFLVSYIYLMSPVFQQNATECMASSILIVSTTFMTSMNMVGFVIILIFKLSDKMKESYF